MNTQTENLKNVPEWNGTRPEIQINTRAHSEIDRLH